MFSPSNELASDAPDAPDSAAARSAEQAAVSTADLTANEVARREGDGGEDDDGTSRDGERIQASAEDAATIAAGR